jgi:hypothetical protein
MNALWWFNDSVAGMARPGFNLVHCLNLSFDEAVLNGWLGTQHKGTGTLESFAHHMKVQAPRTFDYHGMTPESAAEWMAVLQSEEGILKTAEKLGRRMQNLTDFKICDRVFYSELKMDRVNWEIEQLKKHGISTIVSLTEHHHIKDILEDHFSLHHLAINDMCAGTREQAEHLAEVIDHARAAKEKVAVHCLAGIGRTSTMIIAAHLILGESFETLMAQIKTRNPCFNLTGEQGEFVKSLAGKN